MLATMLQPIILNYFIMYYMFNVICVIKEDLFWFSKDKILDRS